MVKKALFTLMTRKQHNENIYLKAKNVSFSEQKLLYWKKGETTTIFWACTVNKVKQTVNIHPRGTMKNNTNARFYVGVVHLACLPQLSSTHTPPSHSCTGGTEVELLFRLPLTGCCSVCLSRTEKEPGWFCLSREAKGKGSTAVLWHLVYLPGRWAFKE